MEKETVFSSKVKSSGLLSFKDFYKFCYEWLTDETGLDIAETKYKEKLSGNSKDIEIDWVGEDKITDYFKFEIKVSFVIKHLTDVEVQQPNNTKIKTNKGDIEINVKGNLIRDYDGKFEKNSTQKFLRGVYEKYVIASRIKQFEAKLAEECGEFLEQAKAYLDLEGKK
jgi:hypothetical protein